MAPSASVDVAIVGAAGNTGAPLVEALARRGAKVRAIVHRPEQAARVPAASQIVALDIDDADALTGALRGAGVVHFIPPVYNPAEERYASRIVGAAVAAGAARIAYHSVLHAYTPGMPHHERKARVEVVLRESPLKWTILQPAMYMQTVLRFFNREAGVLAPGFDVGRPFTPVDVIDLADVAAIVLTEDGHDYATYELAGPARMSFAEMASVLAGVVGKPIAAIAAPAGDFVAAAVARGLIGPQSGGELKAMLDHYDGHGLVGNARMLRSLLGREPSGPAAVFARELSPPGPA